MHLNAQGPFVAVFIELDQTGRLSIQDSSGGGPGLERDSIGVSGSSWARGRLLSGVEIRAPKKVSMALIYY
jgi:hypothetical protein